jgi:hypothetical protein
MKIKIYRNVILLGFYGCEALSLTFREKYRLAVFENGELSLGVTM